VTDGMVYRMFFLGRNFVSSLIFTLNLKNLKTFFKKPRFFQPCAKSQVVIKLYSYKYLYFNLQSK